MLLLLPLVLIRGVAAPDAEGHLIGANIKHGVIELDSNSMKLAKKLFPDAAWVCGDGRYALVAFCRDTTVALYKTMEEAEAQKSVIDEFGCGGLCVNQHKIIDLGCV